MESGARTRANAGSGISFRPGATDSGLSEPVIGALKIKKPASLSDTVSTLLLGLLSLVESADLNVADFGAERQGEFLQ